MTLAKLGMLLWVALPIPTLSTQASPANVAAGKNATQSSTFDGTDSWVNPPLTYRASADLAVDGAPTKNYLDKTCAVTDWLNGRLCTDNPWWQVNLDDLYDVINVTIYQRGGGFNYGPLVVQVGDHVERPENRTFYHDHPVVSLPLSPPVTASTVNISIIGCSLLQLCEVEIFGVRYMNECASTPCHHGGNCTDGLSNYTCVCEPGYTGSNCETDVDECASSPCLPVGLCVDGVSNYTCFYPADYVGFRCNNAALGLYVEGLGTGLGVGLGAAMLLALAIFVLLRCKRRSSPSSERLTSGGMAMSSRRVETATRQGGVPSGQEDNTYESLDDAARDTSPSSPYSELGEAREDQKNSSPHSNKSN